MGAFELHLLGLIGLYLQLTTCLVGGSSSTLSQAFCILNGVPAVPFGQKNSTVLFWPDWAMSLWVAEGSAPLTNWELSMCTMVLLSATMAPP